MELDPLVLARMQFAMNITFHILFPSINIALAWILLAFKLLYQKTGNNYWLSAYRLWVKIFGISFGIGVVTGVTMSFQFGTNWPGFMDSVGNVAGPLIGYEVLTAFFLEATFLGVMLFGEGRISQRAHTIATLLVAIGTTLSVFWILALNSWMQTPQGVEVIDGKVYVLNWMEVIFNPSFPLRFTHMLIASALTAGFFIAGISAHQKLRGDITKGVDMTMKVGVFIIAIMIPLQFVIGHKLGGKMVDYQPEKIAAMEAIWKTESDLSYTLIGFPDDQSNTTKFAIMIPHLGSLLLGGSIDAAPNGLDQFDTHPAVAKTFWSFRAMFYTAFVMLFVSWYIAYKVLRHKKISHRMLNVLSKTTFIGWIAVIGGWYLAEIGRQPWIVHGILRTKDAVAGHTPDIMLSSFILYLLLYIFLFISFIYVIYYVVNKSTDKTLQAEGK